MISNQILQNTIDGLKGITKIDLRVLDTEGNVLAETVAEQVDYGQLIYSFVDSPADSQVLQGFQFFKVYSIKNCNLNFISIIEECTKFHTLDQFQVCLKFLLQCL